MTTETEEVKSLVFVRMKCSCGATLELTKAPFDTGVEILSQWIRHECPNWNEAPPPPTIP